MATSSLSSSPSLSTSSSSVATLTRQQQLVQLEFNHEGKFALMTLNNKPVNSLTLSMMNCIISSIEQVEQYSQAPMNALVITSACRGVFSAGLDLKSLCTSSLEYLTEFWNVLQRMFMKLYSCPLFTVAMINGQCFAGGCVLSLACDYRIIHEQCSIGLNETQFGLVPPWFFIAAYENVIGKRLCEMHVQLGSLLPANEALKISLVDEVHSNPNSMKESALKQVMKWNKVNQFAKRESKLLLRKPLIDQLTGCCKERTEQAVKVIASDKAQQMIRGHLESLHKKQQAAANQKKDETASRPSKL
ncbi:enoyl-CoA hydratase family member [Naegleria gruberi]|uniref:Enoyl-CoA delta isomerase 1, mitochondrial n=1 Tax=Naegleria gruberi TaxID=5762 RepID=D2VNQ9_NAEGR|nr:enoyl-CoA hydratase family member [Naegleria gruberi]EFC41453.1 enoyl-CoA hydratase family member [Naegleria gruberi]|eukprot:XP_002674197.1 enoyl-CoA hydratase family member [Naegleria gruberi strain NEG-M]